jgi:hypothetical protein
MKKKKSLGHPASLPAEGRQYSASRTNYQLSIIKIFFAYLYRMFKGDVKC